MARDPQTPTRPTDDRSPELSEVDQRRLIERMALQRKLEEARLREAARGRVLWLDSDEYKKLNRWTVSLYSVFVVIVIAASILLILFDKQRAAEATVLHPYIRIPEWE